MKKILIALAGLSLTFLASCSTDNGKFSESFKLSVINPLDANRESVLVRLSINEIKKKYANFNQKAFVVLDDTLELSSQVISAKNSDHELLFVIPSLAMNESKNIIVGYNPEGVIQRNYPKLTQAELSHKVGGEWVDREYMGGDFENITSLKVPKEHKDHSWYLRYEGPGWESDKVGYRFYLDQRNATDVFGKKVTEPILHKVGLDGFDSYHEMADWGMDVMKVGNSLGVGSIGMLVDSSAHRVEFTDSVAAKISNNGAVYSSLQTNYYGWATPVDTLNVSSEISIHAGTRLSHQVLNLSKDSEFICSGVAKDEKGELLTQLPAEEQYGYIASFGPYSLNDDNLGVAVLFDQNSFQEFTDDQYSHIVRLSSEDSKVTYYFLATWEGEPGGITNKQEFVDYLDSKSKELAVPVVVTIQ